MVELAKVPRRIVTVEEPRSSLTRADIESPYAAFRSAFEEAGKALEAVAEVGVEEAAARAVTVGPDGQINVERTAIPMVGRVGQHYERLIKTKAVAEADAIADRALVDLRAESRGDPEAFRVAAETYRDREVGRLNAVSPAAGAALKRQIDNRLTQTYSGLLNEHQNIEIRRSNEAIDARILTNGNEAETLARRGGVGTDVQQKLNDVRALLDEKVNNPLLAFPKEEADAFMDALTTRVQGAAIHEQMERVYRERGFEAARTYLRDSTRGLEGRVKQIDKIEREGLAFLRREEAALTGDRSAISQEWARAKGQAHELDPAVLEDIQARAAAVGNTRVATDVAVTRRALETRATVRQLPAEDQARIVGSGGLVSAIVRAESGGDPNARPPIDPATGQRPSSAVGAGQFVRGTWLDLVKRTRPELAEGKSDEQILALRTDPALSREMVGRYAEENKQRLAAAGVRTDDGALYLAHFLGPGDAIKVLSAPAGTPLAGLVNQASIDANRSIFARNPTSDQLQAWATGKVGGNRSDLLARQMIRKDLSADLTTTLAGLDARVKRGEFPPADEVERLGALASVVGTPEQRRKTATIAAISEVGAEFQKMTQPQRDALISAWDQRLQGRASQGESDLGAALRTADKVIDTAYKTDPYGAHVRYGGGQAIPPIDFGKPQEAALVMAAKVKQQNVFREQQGLGPVSALRPAEVESLRGLLATGNAQQVGGALTALNSLPDDILAATLKDEKVKAGITAALHTTDSQKMSVLMSTLDTWYRRNPKAFEAQFGEEAERALTTWQMKTKYMTPEEFTQHQQRALDPAAEAVRKKNVDTVKGEIYSSTSKHRRTPQDVIADMQPFWSLPSLGIGAPLLPSQSAVRDVFFGEYANLYAETYADLLDRDGAHKETIRKLGVRWARSPLNGNEVMLRAPERVYPEINASHDWLKPQVEAAVTEQMGVPMRGAPAVAGSRQPLGTNWDYRMVSDQQTEQEAQRYNPSLPVGETNPAPSYKIVVRDNRKVRPGWEPLPRRFAFDPTAPTQEAQQQFMVAQQRRRELGDTPPSIGMLGVP